MRTDKKNTKIGDTVSQEEFNAHCEANLLTDQKLDQIMWLADDDIKLTMKQIIKDKQGETWLSKKVANGLKIIGIALGIISVVFSIIWTLMRRER
jgi:hypothetical protein